MIWKTILVPHDFSSSANHALAIARDEAKAHGARLLLLHVIDLPSQMAPTMIIVPERADAVVGGVTNSAVVPEGDIGPISVKDWAIREAERHLADLTARVGKDGVTAQAFVRLGKAENEIIQFATEHGVDLIAMGTAGRTGLAHMLIGSVAERVVRLSKCAVLTIRASG
jgi:nucleotide-binding universal stress UspA family protein